MCDSATQQVIEQVVSDKVQKNELFTAFDVTTAVRKQQSGRVFHSEVKKAVHKLYDSGVMGPDYTRSVAVNLNVSPQPFLYHPMSADATEYGQVNPTVAGPTVADVTSDDDSDEDEEDDGDGVKSCKVDGRNTLCIPAPLLRSAGFKSGDPAYVSLDTIGNCLVVTRKPSANLLSQYTVDSYDNVRITQYVLQRGGIGGKKFNVEGDAKKVIVRKP
jgi:hypothetical protein